ncbi:MAG: tRNA lysidine(34) synthetase TilS [Bacteroidales bacterium]|nr:tRNA lysidine(34) synthetase TilS [Bacteroidales bacterium]
MQDRFDRTLARLTDGRPDSRMLLAVSGGIDSMTMADLFLHSTLRLPLAVAHFNFHLRGADSDGDEAFVADWCRRNGIPFFRQEADTAAYAAAHGLSVEMAARRLRYDWFATLCREQGLTHLAVAHNLDDNAETLLLHLLRGTGLRGLTGIRETMPLRGADDASGSAGVQLIRPLLDFSRREIEAYAVRAGVEFRVDATNADVTIARNRLRHEVFPQLAQINPSFLRTLQMEMRHFGQAGQLLDAVFESGRADVASERDGALVINIPALLQKGQCGWWLYRLLEGYGFNADQLAAIERSLEGLSGKEFLSATHRVVKDRRELRVYPLALGPDDLTGLLDVRTFTVMPGFDPKQKPEDVLFVDADKVRLPLSARPPKDGDRFRPFGMHRGSKLLSDFFTDLKLDVEQKRREVVVTTTDEKGDEMIVAIAGRRIDDRFKITSATRTVAAISRIS